MGSRSDTCTGACGRHVEAVSRGLVSGKVLSVYKEDVNVGPDAEPPADAATETLDSFLRILEVGGIQATGQTACPGGSCGEVGA